MRGMNSSAVSWSGKMQMARSQSESLGVTLKAGPTGFQMGNSGVGFYPTGAQTFSGGFGLGKKSNGGLLSPGNISGALLSPGARSSSTPAMHRDIREVRSLAKDEPTSEVDVPRSTHESLMLRLKSREARMKAESNREFLEKYRKSDGSTANIDSDRRLDALLQATAQRAEELRVSSDDLKSEAADAERRLERVNAQNISRANDGDLQAMNPFERSQRRIQEDKRDEELQRQRDEAQANYAKVHRRLQSELIELRDYKVLLREFRRLRLEKLQDMLVSCRDGRRLRACVREMIRHGAQRILQKLENAEVPLEPWMREALVNSCHLEIRIENAEGQILQLRRKALGPVKSHMESMVSQTKRERFQALCARTWESRQSDTSAAALARRLAEVASPDAPAQGTGGGGGGAEGTAGDAAAAAGAAGASRSGSATDSVGGARGAQATQAGVSNVPEALAQEMHSVEEAMAAMRRLLSDVRSNAAAAICHRVRESRRGGSAEAAGREANEWGRQVLTLLVSEDFAKQTLKALEKTMPQAKFAT